MDWKKFVSEKERLVHATDEYAGLTVAFAICCSDLGKGISKINWFRTESTNSLCTNPSKISPLFGLEIVGEVQDFLVVRF